MVVKGIIWSICLSTCLDGLNLAFAKAPQNMSEPSEFLHKRSMSIKKHEPFSSLKSNFSKRLRIPLRSRPLHPENYLKSSVTGSKSSFALLVERWSLALTHATSQRRSISKLISPVSDSSPAGFSRKWNLNRLYRTPSHTKSVSKPVSSTPHSSLARFVDKWRLIARTRRHQSSRFLTKVIPPDTNPTQRVSFEPVSNPNPSLKGIRNFRRLVHKTILSQKSNISQPQSVSLPKNGELLQRRLRINRSKGGEGYSSMSPALVGASSEPLSPTLSLTGNSLFFLSGVRRGVERQYTVTPVSPMSVTPLIEREKDDSDQSRKEKGEPTRSVSVLSLASSFVQRNEERGNASLSLMSVPGNHLSVPSVVSSRRDEREQQPKPKQALSLRIYRNPNVTGLFPQVGRSKPLGVSALQGFPPLTLEALLNTPPSRGGRGTQGRPVTVSTDVYSLKHLFGRNPLQHDRFQRVSFTFNPEVLRGFINDVQLGARAISGSGTQLVPHSSRLLQRIQGNRSYDILVPLLRRLVFTLMRSSSVITINSIPNSSRDNGGGNLLSLLGRTQGRSLALLPWGNSSPLVLGSLGPILPGPMSDDEAARILWSMKKRNNPLLIDEGLSTDDMEPGSPGSDHSQSNPMLVRFPSLLALSREGLSIDKVK